MLKQKYAYFETVHCMWNCGTKWKIKSSTKGNVPDNGFVRLIWSEIVFQFSLIVLNII